MTPSNRKIAKRLWLTLLPLCLALPMNAFAQVVVCTDENENTAVPASTPTSGFDLHDDTVTHTATGLTWMRCSLGQDWDGDTGTCFGVADTYSWEEALNAVAALNEGEGFAGHTDWRLPNKNELASIVEARCWSPHINAAVFPDTQPGYWWSSSPYGGVTPSGQAWRVDFDGGFVNWASRSNSYSVRPVRAGQ
jgi:hypothetical protein